MSRITKILAQARLVLADKAQERWTDDDLLLLLDEGHKDICQRASLLHAKKTAAVTEGSAILALPDDCWKLTRVVYDGSVLPFITHNQLDGKELAVTYCVDGSWETESGVPSAVVYDQSQFSQTLLYPIPDDSVRGAEGDAFGVTVELTDDLITSDFGVIASTSESPLLQEFGVATGLTATIQLQYVQVPADLTTLYDELSTHRMFDTALKYYVVGTAFLADLETSYQAKGTQQLGFYDRDLQIAIKSAAKSNQSASALHSSYRKAI